MSASQVSILKKLRTKLDAKLKKAKLCLHRANFADKHSRSAVKTEGTNNHDQSNRFELANKPDHTNGAHPTQTVEPFIDEVPHTSRAIETEQNNTMELQQISDEMQQLCQTSSQNMTKQQTKAARRAARKEKWAARLASLKCNAKKIGKPLMWSVVIVVGIVLAPLYLAVEIVFSVLVMVVKLVVLILNLVISGLVLAWALCKALCKRVCKGLEW